MNISTLCLPQVVTKALPHILREEQADALGLGIVFDQYTSMHPGFANTQYATPALLAQFDPYPALKGVVTPNSLAAQHAASIASLQPAAILDSVESLAMRLGLDKAVMIGWLTPTFMIVQPVSYHTDMLGLHYDPTGMSGHERLNAERQLMTLTKTWAIPSPLLSKVLT